MSRLLAVPLSILALIPLGCGRQKPAEVAAPAKPVVIVAEREPSSGPAIAPAPHAAPPRPIRLPVAPMPHEPGEEILTIEEPDIGIEIIPGLDVEIIPAVDPVVVADPIGVPAVEVPTIPLAPFDLPAAGGQLVPGAPSAPVAPFSGRQGATKEKLLKANGASEQTERAVARGLAWLAKQQKPDGSWAFDGTAKDETAAATGFSVLAFLGAGETHKNSKRYQKTVQGGLSWLVKHVAVGGANAGKFAESKTMYGQGIAALALCEAYAMTNDPALKPAAQAAVNYIQKAQAADGSWGYTAGTVGDTSILGWQLQALYAAKQSKALVVDDRVIKRAITFLDKVSAGEKKAVYGYRDSAGARPGTALTAIGLLNRTTFDGWGPQTPGLAEGAEGLLKTLPTKARIDPYRTHYATLVLRSIGGEPWRTWNEGPKAADGSRKGGMRDVIVGAQKADGADAGSWDADLSVLGASCGRLGTTALCVITLESYYRHAPAAPRK